MFNDGHNLRPHRRHAARVMHLHRNRDTAKISPRLPLPQTLRHP
jgi:hypothetical protein